MGIMVYSLLWVMYLPGHEPNSAEPEFFTELCR